MHVEDSYQFSIAIHQIRNLFFRLMPISKIFVMHCEAKNASVFGLFSFFFLFSQNLQWPFLTKTNYLTFLTIHALKNQIIIIIIIFEFLIKFILKKFKFELNFFSYLN